MKNIIFDLGGVLIDWNPRHLYRKIFSNEQEMEHFLSHICNQEWNEKQDAGRAFQLGINELAGRHPEYGPQIQAWYDRYPEMLKGPIEGSVRILEILHGQGFPVFALSNWSAETFPFATARFDFLRLFRDVLISGDFGMKKPDPRFYQLLCDRQKISPVESLFIDDLERNVDAARELGFQGHVFRSPELLVQCLTDFGLDVGLDE